MINTYHIVLDTEHGAAYGVFGPEPVADSGACVLSLADCRKKADANLRFLLGHTGTVLVQAWDAWTFPVAVFNTAKYGSEVFSVVDKSTGKWDRISGAVAEEFMAALNSCVAEWETTVSMYNGMTLSAPRTFEVSEDFRKMYGRLADSQDMYVGGDGAWYYHM